MAEFAVPEKVAVDPHSNITDLLRNQVAVRPDNILFSVPVGDTWQDVSAREFEKQVIALAKGFIASGIQAGQHVGLMSRTRYEWSLVDFALWYAGAVSVPIYETSAPAQIEWILGDSGAVAVVVESEEHAAKLAQALPALPLVARSWIIDVGGLDEIAEAGLSISDETVEQRRNLADLDSLATLIYTSGTTGRPKGCELTHGNFARLSLNAAEALPGIVRAEGASTVLFITLAHVFARFISVMCVATGARVGHEPNTANLMSALASFKPTFLLAVPRVFEKVYNIAEQKAEAGGKGRIFRKAASTAILYSRGLDEGGPSLRVRLLHRLFSVLVYKKLLVAMGGQVTSAVSGSAPLGERLGHFYRGIGVRIMEGYGLTESTAPATVNTFESNRIGSVGIPLPGTAVKIADDGEILLKGIDVFRGYWNNPDATAAAFTEDGWFHTGDIGSLDEKGFLTVTGRTKEIIVTAGGKNVAPAFLEDQIRANPVVGQVVVIGDQKPFIAALITLDTEMLPLWLSNHGIDATGLSVSELARIPVVLEHVQDAVDRANEHVSRAESIRKWEILDRDLSESSGHLTPSLKIKRAQVLSDFQSVVDRIYATTAPGPIEKPQRPAGGATHSDVTAAEPSH